MKKDTDYMWYNVTYAHQMYGRRWDTPHMRNRRWVDKSVSGKWIVIRRARLYDGTKGPNGENQQNLIGWIQIAGVGTYHRRYHRETWEEFHQWTETDDEGNSHTRSEWRHQVDVDDNSDTDVHNFVYKMKSYCTDFNIQFDQKASGGWFTADTLQFIATRSPDGLPLFKVVSDGSSKCSVQTFSQSDPVSALLAAFAVSLKMEPKEYKTVCKNYCHSYISLDSHSGQYGGFGPTDEQFDAMNPTPNLSIPPMGFTYGMAVDALPMAMPVMPAGAQPFTAIPTATPVFEPIPMAVPLQTPPIGVAVAYDPIPTATPVVAQLPAQYQAEVVQETFDIPGAVAYQAPIVTPYDPNNPVAIPMAQPVQSV